MQDYFVKDIVRDTDGVLLCGDDNIRVDNISTDSNSISDNCIFVPIIGERVDAHRFIQGAIANGAVAVFTSEHDKNDVCDEKVPYIRVNDTTKALQMLGKAYAAAIDIPKIGITGSVGKTTTKEMIACALSAGKKVFKTAGNSNSQIGVPITLSKMTKEDEIAVIEMGMSMPGEMVRLATLLTLDSAVVTNIGVSHIEQLKTQDGICEEKFHIADALNENGCVFINGDDPVILRHKDELKCKVVSFGLNEGCDYQAVNIVSDNEKVDFDLVINGRITDHIRLNVPGMHNVRNALASIAVAGRYGITPAQVKNALLNYKGVSMRQQITEKDGIIYIDDSYNASPDSMKAGLEVLCSMKADRHIAVLADMLELGPDTAKYHREIGDFIIGKNIYEVIVFGELSANIKARVESGSDISVKSFSTREEITEYLRNSLRKNDAVLFKGSRGMKLNECVEALIQ